MIPGRVFPVTVGSLDTVVGLKANIDDIADIRPESQWLSFEGALLEDSSISMEHIRPSATVNIAVREFRELDPKHAGRYNRRLALQVFRF